MPAGFKKTTDKYILTRTVQQPGSRFMINGQLYEQPGEHFDINLICELVGPGAVISEDGSEEPFELIDFGMELGEDKQSISIGIYYNEPTEFDKYIKQLFRI